MSTLNRSVFDRLLKEGADPATIQAISNAFEIMSEMKDFRAASNDGSMPVIRIAQPGELKSDAEAGFLRGSDSNPPTILIQAQVISRPPNTYVLMNAIYVIAHEFSHAKTEWSGASVGNSALSTEQKIANYINFGLDDETAARHAGLNAMREALQSYPEGTPIVRNLLNANPVFSAILSAENLADERGLTGDSRKRFIAQHARSSMASMGGYLSDLSSSASHFFDQDSDDILSAQKNRLGLNSTNTFNWIETINDDGSVHYEVKYNDGRSFNDFYDADGKHAGHIEYTSDIRTYSWTKAGDELKQYHYDTAGNLSSSSIARLDAAGLPVQESYFDADGRRTQTVQRYYADGKLSADRLFDGNGRQTNFRLIDVGTGHVAQDRTFDPATGKQTGAFVYQDGVLIASADFTNGKQFRYTIFAPASGSPLEMREWDPDTRSATITRYYTDGKLTATRLFDANGRKTNYQLIDSEGRTAQDRVFDPETGKQTQFLNYRDGELIGYGQFVDGKQYGYTSIDALTGQPSRLVNGTLTLASSFAPATTPTAS